MHPHLVHHIYDGVGGVVICASILYTILPPYEKFAQWPKFQSNYQFFLIFLQAFAVNGRKLMSSKVYGNDISAPKTEAKP